MNKQTQPNKQEIISASLIELAREHFAKDFVTTDRRSCPDATTLDSLASSGQLPDDTLRAHLFNCSACFAQYRTAMAERPQPVMVLSEESSWLKRLRESFVFRPAFATGAAAVLLVSVSIWTMRKPAIDSQSPLLTPSPTVAMANPTPIPPADLLAMSNPVNNHKPTLADEVIAKIDLRDDRLRGNDNPSQSSIKLQARRTRLKVTLPEGSLQGRYTLNLLDENDDTVAVKRAVSRTGKKLTLVLNLKGLRPKHYQLNLEHKQEWIGTYDVVVVTPKRSGKR